MSSQKRMIVIPGMDIGGAELQLMQRLALFPEFEMTLVILSDRHALLQHIPLPNDKINLYNQPALRYLNGRGLLKAIPIAWKMMRYCRARNIRDITAHLPMAHWTARWVILFSYLLFYRVRLIVYHHSEQYKVNPVRGLAQRIFTHVQSMLAYITDVGNIFVSEAVKENISRHQYVRNGVVIRNLVRETTCDAALAQGMLTAKEKSFQKYIVIPGRIERVKGQVFFVQALTTELIERIRSTNTLIVFAGGGSDERELKNRVPDNLLGNILITGTLEHAMLLSYMSLADLVVIPSLSEGFGITLVESMMLKRNVISSDAGGLKETIHGSNAIEWFTCGNAAVLQQKLTTFFAGELSFQPEKAYAYYRANFSPEAYREALLQYLTHTLPA